MLTVHKYSDTGFFKLLSNTAFSSVSFQKQINSDDHFFSGYSKFIYISEMMEKIEQIFFNCEIIAFELVALNTGFYWERIIVIWCQ